MIRPQGLLLERASKEYTLIILLIGGEKKTQKRDIVKARKYWTECEELYPYE